MGADVNELTPIMEDYDLTGGGFAKFSGLDYIINISQ